MCKFCFRKWETYISEERVEFFKSINGNYIWQKTFNWKFKYKDTKVHCYRYRSVNELTDTIIVSHVRKSKLGIQMFIEAKSMDEVTKVGNFFSGDSLEWESFIETFETVVAHNERLKNIEKFNYLRGWFKGKAIEVIKGFFLNTKKYGNSWKIFWIREPSTQLYI